MALLLGKISALPADAIYGEERFSAQLADLVDTFEPQISIDTLAGVIDECKKRFTDPETGKCDGVASDQWLAPRLHATLRLAKREAANQHVWNFLCAYAFPDYVAWRWGRDRQSALSKSSDVKKNPFKRLWWGAEMFRNGEDYHTVAEALKRSDVTNTSLSTRIMNNRAVALAVLRFFEKHELTSRQVNPVSTQLKTAAVTVALDFACPNFTDALELDRDWLTAAPEFADVVHSPLGPRHGYVTEDEIRRAEEMLERVIDMDRVRAYRQREGTVANGK